MKKKKTDGFTYDYETQDYKEFNFARLVFNNYIGMKKFSFLPMTSTERADGRSTEKIRWLSKP